MNEISIVLLSSCRCSFIDTLVQRYLMVQNHLECQKVRLEVQSLPAYRRSCCKHQPMHLNRHHGCCYATWFQSLQSILETSVGDTGHHCGVWCTGAENTETNRRDWRELLYTAPGLGQYISGAIMFEETLYQSCADGTPFVDVLRKQGIVPGIKVDTGLSVGAPLDNPTTSLLPASSANKHDCCLSSFIYSSSCHLGIGE